MELTQEQINSLNEAITKLAEACKEILTQIKEIFMDFIKQIDFRNIDKIRKYSKIYARTSNQRIKKKQLKKIRELLL